MSDNRVISVVAIWIVVQIALLLGRAIIAGRGWPDAPRVLRVLDRCILVMAIAIAFGGLASLTRVDAAGLLHGSPAATTHPATGNHVPGDLGPSPEPSRSGNAGETVRPNGTRLWVSPAPATMPPSALPSPESPTFESSPQPSGSALASGGVVSVSSEMRRYEIQDGRVAGYRDLVLAAPFTASCTRPETYPVTFLSNPNGHVTLVRILSGEHAGEWVSPDDPGVRYADQADRSLRLPGHPLRNASRHGLGAG